ncbi:MAG: hypothetical protein ACLVAI_06585 [Anaerovoracaceae bacterium]
MTELVTAALEGDPDGIIMDTGAVYVMENLKTLLSRNMWTARRQRERRICRAGAQNGSLS